MAGGSSQTGRSPTCFGEINHRDRSYSAEHPLILDQALSGAAQAKLNENRLARRRKNEPSPALRVPGEQPRLKLTAHIEKLKAKIATRLETSRASVNITIADAPSLPVAA